MLGRLKAFLSGDDKDETESPDDALRVATAALLVELARMDEHVDPAEHDAIVALLGDRFELGREEIDALIEQGKNAADDAVELYGFARIVKDRWDHEDRIRLVEMLWEVALADGRLDDFETGLMRRLTGLVYVSDRESAEARQRVRTRLQEN